MNANGRIEVQFVFLIKIHELRRCKNFVLLERAFAGLLQALG